MKSCNQVAKLATRNEIAKSVLINGEKTFNKTRILKIVEDSRGEFASGIARRDKVRCPRAGSG